MRRMYSENQIGEIALKQLSNKDLKVKTIEQSEPNFSASFNFIGLSGLKVKDTYNRFEVINNVLYVIVNVEIYNDTESGITATYLADCSLDLPENLASNIYDCAGKSVAESGAGVWIASELGYIKENDTGSYPNSYGRKAYCELMVTNNNTPNKITIAIAGAETLGIPTGKSEYISGRIALTLK